MFVGFAFAGFDWFEVRMFAGVRIESHLDQILFT